MCCLYSPPCVLSICINVLCNITDFISADYKNVCFVGNYNLFILIRFLEGTVNISSVLSDFIDYILLHSLTQVVTSPTKSDNLLDLIFCSQFLMYSCVSYIHSFSSSDHSSLELQIFVEQVNSMSNNIDYYYDFSYGGYESFNMYINSID